MFDIGELVIIDDGETPYTGIVIDRFPKTGGDYGDRSYQILFANSSGQPIKEWRGDDGTFALDEWTVYNEDR
tara:strand:- start:430 stop:645 length:216 start_codon:yes stop_codon:yes gene_type:complete